MRRPLCWAGLGFFAAAAVFSAQYPALRYLLFLVPLCLLSGIFLVWPAKSRGPAIFLLSFGVMLLFCAAFSAFRADPVRALAGKTLPVSGMVLETGRASFLLDGTAENGQDIRVQVWCQPEQTPDRYQEFSGTVDLSEITSTDRFDSESYYRSRGIYLQGRMTGGTFRMPETLPLLTLPGRLNDWLCGKVRAALPAEASGFVCAVVLGNREHLEESQYQLMDDLGLGHLLAVSGMHLSLLAGMLASVLGRGLLGRGRIRLLVQMAFVLFYMALTGFGHGVSRAGVMLLLSLLARLLSLRSDLLTSLCAAAMVMLFYNPFLAMSPGFQFSFLCAAGVGIFSEPMAKILLAKIKNETVSHRLSGATRAFCSALCGCAAALPLSVWYDSRFVPMSLPANLLLAPLFVPVLALCSVFVLLVSSPLASLAAVPVYWTVRGFFALSGLLEQIGPAPLYGSGPAFFLTAVFLTGGAALAVLSRNRRNASAAICLAIVASAAAVTTQTLLFTGDIHNYTAVFDKRLLTIFTYGQRAVVIGHLGSESQIEQGELELRRQRVSTIDALVLLPTGGDPRVSLSLLTEKYEVGLVAYSSKDNLTTQAAESLDGIPYRPLEELAFSFWGMGRFRFREGGAAEVSAGAKKLLILPAECVILEPDDTLWDLILTSWDTRPPAQGKAWLCSRLFWGGENEPHRYLIPYGRGIRYRIAAG